MNVRRRFLQGCSGFIAFALVAELAAARATAQSVSARRWVAVQRELALGLRAGSLTELQWHAAVNSLARELDLEQMAAELRRARIKDAGAPFGHDPQKRFVAMLDDKGELIKLGYGLALFDFDEDSVITPHAHRHMVSAHMVIDGTVRIRTFDRIADEARALLIRPTADVLAGPGYAAAMTTPRDNIHWFAPRSRRAMTLDVIIDGLGSAADRYEIQPVDPLGGQQLADGSIRAPLISFEQSMQRYNARL
jgi:hypothetical protein